MDTVETYHIKDIVKRLKEIQMLCPYTRLGGNFTVEDLMGDNMTIDAARAFPGQISLFDDAS